MPHATRPTKIVRDATGTTLRLTEWFAAMGPRLLKASGASNKPGRRPFATLVLQEDKRTVAIWDRAPLVEKTATDIVRAATFDTVGLVSTGDHEYVLTAYGQTSTASEGSCPFSITTEFKNDRRR